MDLATRLHEEMKAALKAGQKERLGVIRMLLNDVKNIDLAPKPTTAEEAVAAYCKKLRKSVEEFERIGKADEVAKLKGEIAIVEEFMPRKADTSQTEELVRTFLAGHSFTEKQFGQAMGMFMKAHGPAVDPAVANQLMRKALSGKA